MTIDIIKECDGGFTQPSAVSGIRQDLFKKKVEENNIDKNSKNAGTQFMDYVEKTQDDVNDFIEVAGWEDIPSKIRVEIKKFQSEFDRIINEYSTPPRKIPLYRLWRLLSSDEQGVLLNMLDNVNSMIDNSSMYTENIKKLQENT